ncbi:hypothetical protein ACRYCC_26495 [Actinomadura scrupuli]|uniref:hypothetical protein n=1 Tax=Actinomadura scrupuli TaxID=559629 RepID=UPI003D97C8EA
MSLNRYDRREARGNTARAVARGLLAVLLLVLTGVDALATALVGLPPLAWIGRKLGRELADEYRRGYHGALDAEVIEGDE